MQNIYYCRIVKNGAFPVAKWTFQAQNVVGWGSIPDPPLGEFTTLPQTLSLAGDGDTPPHLNAS